MFIARAGRRLPHDRLRRARSAAGDRAPRVLRARVPHAALRRTLARRGRGRGRAGPFAPRGPGGGLVVTQVDSPSSIASTLTSADDLSADDRGAMHALLDRHFAGVTRVQFEADLAQKNVVLRLHDDGGALVGFSTMLVYETSLDGAPVSVVCSGDTIVDPRGWGAAALPREWIAAVNRLRASYPRGPYYWLLITSGSRTYRLPSTFWRSFHPRFEAPTPPDQQRLLDHLARERFGSAYDAPSGIVRFARPRLLRPHLAGIPPARLDDPHVAFFAQRNPSHDRGDELACLCELAESNLTRAGRRMVFGAARAEARGA